MERVGWDTKGGLALEEEGGCVQRIIMDRTIPMAASNKW